jgi:hypothetical protein
MARGAGLAAAQETGLRCAVGDEPPPKNDSPPPASAPGSMALWGTAASWAAGMGRRQ